MVVLQTARTVTGYFLAFDDSDYLAQSTTALYTNTINQYEPQTGRQVDILDQIEPHHKIALWGIIWATMTQLTGIHPSILCRTLLPVIVIPAAYIIMSPDFEGHVWWRRRKALGRSTISSDCL